MGKSAKRTSTPWKENKKLVSAGFRDLKYVPRERCGWDMTLSCLAYGMRMDIERRQPHLNAWAARHGVAASGRYEEFGEDALVLWHGTTRKRAEAIAEHGLFHKKGVWAAMHPSIPHSFCRGRSDRYGTEGAVVGLVFHRKRMFEELAFDIEPNENVFRFHHGLSADFVEYVLVHEEIRFAGTRRARAPRPWLPAKLKKRSGAWVPVQNPPIRYSDSESYSTAEEFARLTFDRLLAELKELSALEVFTCLYAGMRPWDALEHEDVLALVEEGCVPCRQRGKWQTYRARAEA